MTPTLILTADPDFAEMALDELRQARPQATVVAELHPGIWAVQTPDSFFNLAQQWQQSPPIFVRHVCPVQQIAPITGTDEDIEALATAVRTHLADFVDSELPFSVQTRILGEAVYKPFAVNNRLAQIIREQAGAPLNVRAPVQILSVVISRQTGQAYSGLSLARHNLSDWAGGAQRFARRKGQISRAEFKLLEALSVFQIDLPPRGRALDLGAAPGGWTRVLRQHEQYVTAVDPARLHPSLENDKNVRHMRLSAETYLTQFPDTFDLIVNDMRLDARDSARLMVAYAPYLYPHGLALMTFKLPAENRTNIIDHAFNILQKAYTIAGARQLFHNRSEITVYLRPQQM